MLVACHGPHAQPSQPDASVDARVDAVIVPPDAPTACVSIATCAQPTFPIPVAEIGTPSGGNTGELQFAVADFNGDGTPDLAVLSGRDVLSVMNGRSGRRFGTPTLYTTDEHAISLAAGDLDNDGDIDLVIATEDYVDNPAIARVMINDGTGAFVLGESYEGGDAALADVDGDGFLDIMAGGRGEVHVFYNSGAATFGPATTYTTGGQPAYGSRTPLAADLDGDGALDLVTTANVQDLVVMLRRGTGYTTSLVAISSDQYQTAGIALGDFDHDGDIDVLADTTSYPGDSVRVMANDGTGGFTALAPTLLPPNDRLDASGDLDGDGVPDLVVRSITDQHVGVLLGGGTGGFTQGWTFAPGLVIDSTVLADLDGDGKPELSYSFANDNEGVVANLAGGGDGTFATPATLASAAGPSVPARIGDVDNDGKPDVLRGGYVLEVLRNLGDGFATAVVYPAFRTGSLALGDVDGDGRIDAVTADSWNGAHVVTIALNTSAGFVAAGSVQTDPSPYHMALGDLDGDGRPELVVACEGTFDPTHTRPSVPGGLDIYRNNGGGSFTLVTHLDGEYAHVAVDDVDRDGRADVFADRIDVAGVFGGAELLPGHGDGTLDAPIALPGSGYRLVDMTGDRILDEVFFADGGAITIAVARSDGTYAAPVTGPANVLAIGDVDGDCIPDVVTRDAVVYGVFHGNGDGTFTSLAQFEGTASTAVQIADFNGDGLGDVLIGPQELQAPRCAP